MSITVRAAESSQKLTKSPDAAGHQNEHGLLDSGSQLSGVLRESKRKRQERTVVIERTVKIA